MRMVMSCYKCGSKDFKRTEMSCFNIENISYLDHERGMDNKVICSKCGHEDIVANLVIRFE